MLKKLNIILPIRVTAILLGASFRLKCFVLFLFECVVCLPFFLFRVNKINDPTQTLNELISIKSTSFSEDILCLFFQRPIQFNALT